MEQKIVITLTEDPLFDILVCKNNASIESVEYAMDQFDKLPTKNNMDDIDDNQNDECLTLFKVKQI